jgi:hypothetical protein
LKLENSKDRSNFNKRTIEKRKFSSDGNPYRNKKTAAAIYKNKTKPISTNQKSKIIFDQQTLEADNAALGNLENNISYENSFDHNNQEKRGKIEEVEPGEGNLKHELITNNENKKLNSKQNENLFSSDNILDTIKLISHNPSRFKYTNQILRSLGQLTTKNFDFVMNDPSKDEKVSKALKELGEAEKKRELVLENVRNRNELLKRNEIEVKENKSKIILFYFFIFFSKIFGK